MRLLAMVLLVVAAGCAAPADEALCLPYRLQLPDRECRVESYGEEPFLVCDSVFIEYAESEGDEPTLYCATEVLGPCFETVAEVGERCIVTDGFYCRRFP